MECHQILRKAAQQTNKKCVGRNGGRRFIETPYILLAISLLYQEKKCSENYFKDGRVCASCKAYLSTMHAQLRYHAPDLKQNSY